MSWKSLRTRIALPYTLLVVAAVLVPGAIAIREGFQTLTARSHDSQLAFARLIAASVGRELLEKQQALEGMARVDSLRRMIPARIDADITLARLHQLQFTSLFVLDAQGKVVSFVDRPWLVGRDLAFRDYFREALRLGRSYFSDSIFTVEKTITVIISTPIVAEGGETVGVLAGSFDVLHRNFNRIIVDAHFGATGRAFLVDRRGIVVAHPDTQRALQQEDMSRHDIVRSVMAGRQGVGSYTAGGQEMLAAYAPVEPSGWGLVVEQSLAEALAPATRLRTLVLVALIASVAIAMLLSALLSGRLAAPLTRLRGAAESIGAGRLDEPVPDLGRDEIGGLGKAFDAMRLGLARDIAAREQAEGALRASLERYRLLFDNANDGILVIYLPPEGPPDRYVEVNRAACAMFGYTREEFLDLTPAALLDPAAGVDLAAALTRLEAEGDMVFERALVGKDGRRITVEMSAHVFDLDGRRAALSLLRDVTERRRAEDQREGLARVARQLTESLDLSEVGSRIMNSVVPLLRARSAGLSLLRPDGSLEMLAVSEPHGLYLAPGEVLPAGEGVPGRVTASGQAVRSADVLAEPDLMTADSLRRRIEESGEGACLAVPARVAGKMIGVLSVADATGRQFSESEVTLLQAIADQAALGLENARLFAEERRRRREAEVLAQVSGSLNGTLDVDTVLQRVVEGARELCGSDLARIALPVFPGSNAVIYRYGSGSGVPGWEGMAIEPGKGLAGRVLLTGRPARTDRYLEDPQVSQDYAALVREEGIVAGLAVPIQTGGRVEGLIMVFNRSARPFTDRDEAVLTRLADQAAMALGNAALLRSLGAAGERLQALSRRLMEVREAEQRQLARELHDELGQGLTAAKMNLEVQRRGTVDAAAGARLEETIGIVDRVLQQVRDLSLELRPSVLDDLGLFPALRWYVARQAERTGLQATVGGDLGPGRLDPALETACFRVAQEAVTNVVRHAGARSLQVEVARGDGEIRLTVTDDGAGFDVAAARGRAARGESLGLLGMEERVVLLGGRLDIESTPGQGTRLRARVPLEPRPAGAGSAAGGAAA